MSPRSVLRLWLGLVAFWPTTNLPAIDTDQSPAVSLAIAPISAEYFDGQEMLGESLTSLLVASLSNDTRIQLVDRTNLDAVETEWLIGASLVGSTSAVTQGRLLGADWILTLRPDMRSLEHPRMNIDIIDALRAEPLASSSAALSLRPRARWFRNPPAADLAAVEDACRRALADASKALDLRAGKRAAALLAFVAEIGTDEENAARVSELEAAMAAEIESPPQPQTTDSPWRVLAPLSTDSPRGEALLRSIGFVAERSTFAPEAIADAFVWGRLQSGGRGLNLRYWVWTSRTGTVPDETEGTTTEIARHVALALHGLPEPTDSPTLPENVTAAPAREIAAEARTLAAASTDRPTTAAVRSLLELAAFFAPTDREIQELRIIASRRFIAHDNSPSAARERIRFALDYARVAEMFWRKPHDRFDLRLLAGSFEPSQHNAPGQMRRAALAAPLLSRMPIEDLCPHVSMLNDWMLYCLEPSADGFVLLESVLPLLTVLSPHRVDYGHGRTTFRPWIPQFIDNYRGADRERLLAIVDALHRPEGDAADVRPSVPTLSVENSSAPDLPGFVPDYPQPPRSARTSPSSP